MKNTLFFFFLLFPLAAKAKPLPAKLKFSFEFILAKVLEKKKQAFRAEVPLPSLHYESHTPLKVFQDAIEAQWGMRPEQISNAYSLNHNMLFISDDAAYYERTGRCMDDSLAHELVHYVQHKYLHWDFSDESLEWEAIEIQSQFREEYCVEN
jgi:hypothetical protein